MSIQQKVAKGFAVAALKVGKIYAHYRPVSDIGPFSEAALKDPLNAAITQDDLFRKPFDPMKPEALGYMDPEAVLVGDYLVSTEGVWLVFGKSDYAPISLIHCPHRVTIRKPGNSRTTAFPNAADGAVVASNLPCYLRLGGGNAKDLSMPNGIQHGAGEAGGSAAALWRMVAPAEVGDVVVDDFSKARFTISSITAFSASLERLV